MRPADDNTTIEQLCNFELYVATHVANTAAPNNLLHTLHNMYKLIPQHATQ